jgi:hypothetical protein
LATDAHVPIAMAKTVGSILWVKTVISILPCALLSRYP